MLIRLFLAFVASFLAACAAGAEPLSREEIASHVMPPYSLGEPLNDRGVWGLLNSGGAEAGYVFETEPMAPLPGFSGRAINVLVMLDLDGRFIAVNRSDGEDAAATVSDSQINTLFRDLPFVRVDQRAGNSTSLVEEIWRAFLIIMLIAMIGEAALCLPRVRPNDSADVTKGATA